MYGYKNNIGKINLIITNITNITNNKPDILQNTSFIDSYRLYIVSNSCAIYRGYASCDLPTRPSNHGRQSRMNEDSLRHISPHQFEEVIIYDCVEVNLGVYDALGLSRASPHLTNMKNRNLEMIHSLKKSHVPDGILPG